MTLNENVIVQIICRDRKQFLVMRGKWEYVQKVLSNVLGTHIYTLYLIDLYFMPTQANPF